MRSHRGTMPLLAALVISLSACGGANQTASTTTTSATATSSTGTSTTSNPGGDRLPVQQPDERYGHHPRLLTGDLVLGTTGCWAIDLGDGPRLVVFPAGFTTETSDASTMEAPDGVSFNQGDRVDILGGFTPTESLPETPDGFWVGHVALCDPQIAEVVVADTMEPAFDPTVLNDDQLLGMLEDAALTRSWGCGFGFNLSTDDQRVAIHLYPQEMGPVSGPVTFPDAGWVAEMLIGKHLNSNHCDDVIESWEPETTIAAVWPLGAGTLDFTVPANAECGVTEPITSVLRDAVVDTPLGTHPLEELTIVNEAYGCIPG